MAPATAKNLLGKCPILPRAGRGPGRGRPGRPDGFPRRSGLNPAPGDAERVGFHVDAPHRAFATATAGGGATPRVRHPPSPVPASAQASGKFLIPQRPAIALQSATETSRGPSHGRLRPAQNKEQSMDIKRIGSRPSAKGPAEWFTGAVRIDPLFDAREPGRAGGASVTFEPGARTAWHTHPLGQTLI